MILTYGTEEQLERLAQRDWFMVELRSEKTVEATLKRIGIQIPSIFCNTAIEIFIPVLRRDINIFELKTSTYLFARSDNFHGLLRLRTITGVVGLVTLGDTNHPAKAIPVANEYVEQVIEECRVLFDQRARSITLGSFVRILDGDEKNFCGLVVDINSERANIEIDIKTKILLVETPVKNLLDLSHVAEEMRVFYYCPAVEALFRAGLKELIEQDLRFAEDPVYHDDHYNIARNEKRGRQQTVTAMVKRLILTGTLSPASLAQQVVDALREGRLKTPKNIGIVHTIIKQRLIEDYFQKQDPGLSNYREVVQRFGAKWRFPSNEFAVIGKDLGLPESEELESDEPEAEEPELREPEMPESEEPEPEELESLDQTKTFSS